MEGGETSKDISVFIKEEKSMADEQTKSRAPVWRDLPTRSLLASQNTGTAGGTGVESREQAVRPCLPPH